MLRSIIIFINLVFFSFLGFSQDKERFMDFSYITPGEEKHNLYDIKTDYILLYFYSPVCEDCEKIKKKLINNQSLNSLIETKTITLLAVLPDVEKEYWLDNLECVPNNWINGWNENDREIITAYLHTVPTFFVLDKDKNIVLCPNEKEVLKWIKTISK